MAIKLTMQFSDDDWERLRRQAKETGETMEAYFLRRMREEMGEEILDVLLLPPGERDEEEDPEEADGDQD